MSHLQKLVRNIRNHFLFKSSQDEERTHVPTLDGWRAPPHSQIVCAISGICRGNSLGDACGKKLGEVQATSHNAFDSR